MSASPDPGSVAVPLSPQQVPDNREAVIAIQGGGIYALPMLGQARAVLAAGYVPLGFAGNSGGAILATLLWAGLTPNRIEDALTQLVGAEPDAFKNLLLPEGAAGTEFTLEDLHAVPDRLRAMLPLPASRLGWVRAIWRHRTALRELVATLTPHWTQRGIFDGGRFTALIERLVREGLDLPGRTPVTFGDARTRAGRRPPLLLTITNVSRGRLELIDSTDPAYDDMSIAAAVRASAGFPVFFRPIDLTGAAAGRCFVDGGMIANFPLWAFSRTFREKLQQREDYGWLAPRPWLPIGLRVRDPAEHIDVTAPATYVRRLAAIASGMARNDMEDRLVAATQTNALVIAQAPETLPRHPATGRPLNVLDVDAITAANIGQIVRSGETAAQDVLRSRAGYQIYEPDCGPAVEELLDDLLRRCEHAMRAPPELLGLRANIFMPVGLRLEMRFSARMEGMSDDGLQFPDLATGVNGWCYQTRSPAICNLQLVAGVAAANGGRRPFNMSRRLQDSVESRRTWLITFPVFDPAEQQTLRVLPRGSPDVYAPGIRRLNAALIGPILGLVNVDAAWDYDAVGLDPSPDIHVDDPRIVGLIDTMAQASIRLAHILIPSAPLIR